MRLKSMLCLLAVLTIIHIYGCINESGGNYRWEVQAETNVWLSDIYALDEDHVWAVSIDGKIFYGNGSNWTLQFETEATRFNSVAAVDSANVWAVGENPDGEGTIFRYDGTSWSELFCTQESLSKVSILDASHIWAIGNNAHDGGVIYFYDGKSLFRQYESGDRLSDIDVLDEKNAWAIVSVGEDRSKLLFYNGNTWEVRYEGDEPLRKLSAVSEKEIWILGNNSSSRTGGVYLFDRMSMKNKFAYEDGFLRSICTQDSQHIWVVGDAKIESTKPPKSNILFSNGELFSIEHVADQLLTAVHAANNHVIWAVGTYGLIYQGTLASD